MKFDRLFKIFWILLNLFMGFALGWIVLFGFFNLGNNKIIIPVSIISALLHGYVWYKIFDYKKSENIGNYRSLRNKVLIFQSLIVIFFVGLYAFQKFSFQNQPLITKNYEKTFTRLWTAMDKSYPYFTLKEVDWNASYDKYYPVIQNSKGDEEFYISVAEMLGELNDAHTHLVSPTMDRPKYASVSHLGDLAVIEQVGYSASMAGLKPGMLLLEINDESIDSLIDGIDISTHSAATPWANKVRAKNYLLEVPEDENEDLKVKVIDPSGNELELIIKRLSPPANWQISQNQLQNKSVLWEFISNDIGYIRIDRLWNSNDDVVSEFDSALESLFKTRGLILDLRQNGGGDSRIGDKIAGRFLNEPFMYGTDHFRNRIYSHAWKKSVNYFVNPRGKIYPGKLVLLTDYGIMSSAEWLVGALTDSDRAISIGRTTGGSTGNPIQFSLPGGMVRYSTAAFYRPDGRLVEGVGYEPDILIDYTIDDFKKGIDPDIQTAIEWLEKQQ